MAAAVVASLMAEIVLFTCAEQQTKAGRVRERERLRSRWRMIAASADEQKEADEGNPLAMPPLAQLPDEVLASEAVHAEDDGIGGEFDEVVIVEADEVDDEEEPVDAADSTDGSRT